MLDITAGLVPTGNSRESVERDTLTDHVAAIADQLPVFKGRNEVVTLAWIGEQVGDNVLGSFDFDADDIDERTLQNARQNARNWSAAAVRNRYPGFVDGKFEFYAVPDRQAGKTVAIRYALRGVKRAKAIDEV